MIAPLTKDEAARLEALRQYAILDTPRESDFDDVVRLAAEVCQMPVSLVSLVDKDRQWFKGRYGLEVQQTPRRVSFCAHAILDAPQVMMVPDATLDQRFADNELVTGPLHIRFYAGAPLVTPEGHALGTLCVIDYKPNHLNATQLNALRVLSRQVVIQLELRRRLHELGEASQELAETNKELEGFAHTLSHDLRTPLRAVVSLAEILHKQYAAKLDPMAVELLKRLEQTGYNATELLEDLLRLLRLKAQPLNRMRIDMKQLAEEALQELQPISTNPATRVQIDPLPPVWGDRGQLRQVWLNLLGNALKFSRKRETPLIHIRGTEETDQLVYCVKDNGVGFDTKDSEQLWTAFHRLHGSDFEGTGLGLSIVQRIVQRHGGCVSAEGIPGKGANFCFALPKGEPVPPPARNSLKSPNAAAPPELTQAPAPD